MRISSLVVVSCALLLCGCERPDPAAGAGAELFDAHCAVCHGPGGDVRRAASHDPDTPDLREVARRSGGRVPRGALAEVIDGRRVVQAHTRSMPAWGDVLGNGDDELARARINALLDYIESIQVR